MPTQKRAQHCEGEGTPWCDPTNAPAKRTYFLKFLPLLNAEANKNIRWCNNALFCPAPPPHPHQLLALPRFSFFASQKCFLGWSPSKQHSAETFIRWPPPVPTIHLDNFLRLGSWICTQKNVDRTSPSEIRTIPHKQLRNVPPEEKFYAAVQ